MASEDLKSEMLDILKSKGLDVAEDALAQVVEGCFDMAEVLIKKSENKFDDMALVVLPKLKQVVLDLVDKLDKEDDDR